MADPILVNKIITFSTHFSSRKVYLLTLPRIHRQMPTFVKVVPLYLWVVLIQCHQNT